MTLAPKLSPRRQTTQLMTINILSGLPQVSNFEAIIQTKMLGRIRLPLKCQLSMKIKSDLTVTNTKARNF
ncbi:hypothetical protein BHYA_0014g00340 [Botrytis hyacinthi]|uniref:Uncharacterized protein n=1 Tax=Botrytis hyacinthi TaxID=278943 RepID=A0A4Z1H2L7_9HELO|nr:hypothetical protein BHYA_0014g00340 [Botrytis hyacinthi]